MVTPGSKREIGPEDERELAPKDATAYRASVARGNYLAQDRTDIQFAVKELSRSMSAPTEGDWMSLKRLGRYLVDKTRVKVQFRYQEEVGKYKSGWTRTTLAVGRREDPPAEGYCCWVTT